LIPTSTSNSLAQVAQDAHPLEGLDVRMQVAHPHPEVVIVLGQVLGHALGERGDEDALVAGRPEADLGQQVVHLAFTGRTSTTGSIRPVGRITCSTTTPPAFCSS